MQYLQEATVTSIDMVKAENKVLPCITFCPFPAFKSSGLPLTDEEYENKVYHLDDIFEPTSVSDLRNSSRLILQSIY